MLNVPIMFVLIKLSGDIIELSTWLSAAIWIMTSGLNLSKTLPIFTSKQLFAQLILSGGFFTVLAPLLISKIGLDYWTEICASITLFTILVAYLFNKRFSTSYQ